MKKKLLFSFLIIITIITLGACKSFQTQYNQNDNTEDNTIVTTPSGEKSDTPTPAEDLSTIEEVTIRPTITSPATEIPTNSSVPTAPTQEVDVKVTPAIIKSSAEEILKNMSLEEKVGQLFFVRCNKKQAVADIKSYKLGGYILFADDFKNQTKSSMKKILNRYQIASNIPLSLVLMKKGVQ